MKLRQILTENTCIKKFGNYLFGEFTDFYKKEMEVDTADERAMFKELWKFARGDFEEGKMTSKFVKGIKELQKCSSQYPAILSPPPRKLYRGTAIKIEDFVKQYVDSKKYKNGMVSNFEYAPRSEVQSWTTNRYTAESFLNTWHDPDKGTLGCILTVDKPDKTFLFNPDFMNLLYSDEDEVLRVGKKIKCRLELTGMAQEYLDEYISLAKQDDAAFKFAAKKKKDIDDIIAGGLDLYSGISGFDDEF